MYGCYKYDIRVYVCQFHSLELGSQMSAGKKTLDDGFNGKNGKGDSKGSKQSSISATNVVVKKASQMSAGAYGRQDGQITDYSIIHKQKTLDYTDEGFTGKKGKGNSQGSSTSGTNMDVKKKPKVS